MIIRKGSDLTKDFLNLNSGERNKRDAFSIYCCLIQHYSSRIENRTYTDIFQSNTSPLLVNSVYFTMFFYMSYQLRSETC